MWLDDSGARPRGQDEGRLSSPAGDRVGVVASAEDDDVVGRGLADRLLRRRARMVALLSESSSSRIWMAVRTARSWRDVMGVRRAGKRTRSQQA